MSTYPLPRWRVSWVITSFNLCEDDVEAALAKIVEFHDDAASWATSFHWGFRWIISAIRVELLVVV